MDINVLIPLAQGSEELEAVTLIDLFRRAGIRVTVAGENEIITCSRGVKIIPDVLLDTIDTDLEFDAIILPGGAQGTDNLMKHSILGKMLEHQKAKGKMIAAICAAPTVLAYFKILDKGQKITSHPSVRDMLTKYSWVNDKVVVDGIFVTSKGAGTAIEFALYIIGELCGDEITDKVAEGIVYR
jgi:4-methyl-5(b-hydroxyethyl)-thiazole monophosphate biosynthesis